MLREGTQSLLAFALQAVTRSTPHTVLAPPPPVRTGPGTAGAGVDPLAPPKVKVLEGAGLRRAPPVKVRALRDAPRKVGRCGGLWAVKTAIPARDGSRLL